MKQKKQKTKTELYKYQHNNQPFIEHLYELRQRLIYIAVFVVTFGTVGYLIQHQLIAFLLKPAKGQQFIYTTPGGGLNFIIQVSIYFGFIMSIPVIVYHIMRYLEPLMRHRVKHTIGRYFIASGFLAICGAAFGYFAGLPVALSFLSRQFTTNQIKPLLTIQDYFSFVTIYLIGCALLFQLPLILLFINRITPLKPKKLLAFERYLILMAFIAAAVLTPTPDIFNQILFAGPIILTYQVGIILIFIRNRRGKHNPKLAALYEMDAKVRAERESIALLPYYEPNESQPYYETPNIISQELPNISNPQSKVAWDVAQRT